MTSRSPAPSPLAVGGDALAAHAQHLAALRSRRDLHRDRRVERRHLHLGAERRLGERDRQPQREVVAAAPEDRVRRDVHDHVEVAGRTAVRARAAAALHPDALAVGDARRDAHLHLAGRTSTPRPLHVRARRRDDLAAAAAGGAHLRERERALVDGDRARAAALRARLGHRARRRARARARRARRLGAEAHRRW